MTQKVQCPNAGRCGHTHHFVSSGEYAKCLKLSSAGHSGSVVDFGNPPATVENNEQYDRYAMSQLDDYDERLYYEPVGTLTDKQVDLLLSGNWSADEIAFDLFELNKEKRDMDEQFCEEVWEDIRHEQDGREFSDIADTPIGESIAAFVESHADTESLVVEMAINTGRESSEPYMFNIGNNAKVERELSEIMQRIYEDGDDYQDGDVRLLTDTILDNFFSWGGDFGSTEDSREPIYDKVKEMINDCVGHQLTGEEINIAWQTDDLLEMMPTDSPSTVYISQPTLNFNVFSDNFLAGSITLDRYKARCNIGARGEALDEQDHIHRARQWSDQPCWSTAYRSSTVTAIPSR